MSKPYSRRDFLGAAQVLVGYGAFGCFSWGVSV